MRSKQVNILIFMLSEYEIHDLPFVEVVTDREAAAVSRYLCEIKCLSKRENMDYRARGLNVGSTYTNIHQVTCLMDGMFLYTASLSNI